ncbi:MAG: riboflavin synthase [Chitinispirillales bacterium]|jgi:riboflavin synthase|nr:riboflavin synthase [Chitinispirillales bacterium]
MFTGLIETTGVIASVSLRGGAAELLVKPDAADFVVEIGASVSVDGVCLTLERRDGAGGLFFTAVAETLGRASFNRAFAGRRVNMERAMPAGGRLDGHIVLGHVDAAGRIVYDEKAGVSVVRTIEIPEDLYPLTAEKGSIAVDGISLTVVRAERGSVSISLIPATMAGTTMGDKKAGDGVNIECDVLARYIYGMIRAGVPVNSVLPVNRKEALVDKMERLGY